MQVARLQIAPSQRKITERPPQNGSIESWLRHVLSGDFCVLPLRFCPRSKEQPVMDISMEPG